MAGASCGRRFIQANPCSLRRAGLRSVPSAFCTLDDSCISDFYSFRRVFFLGHRNYQLALISLFCLFLKVIFYSLGAISRFTLQACLPIAMFVGLRLLPLNTPAGSKVYQTFAPPPTNSTQCSAQGFTLQSLALCGVIHP